MDSSTQTTSAPKRHGLVWIIILVVLVLVGWYLFQKKGGEGTGQSAEDARKQAVLEQVGADSSGITTSDADKAAALKQVSTSTAVSSKSKTNPPLTNTQKEAILNTVGGNGQ